MPNLHNFMRMAGEKFKLRRNDEEIAVVEGMHNSEHNRKYVGFYPETDVQPGDWIIGEVSGNEFYSEDTKTDVVHSKAFQKKGYYLTKVQYEQKQKENDRISNQFHIGNVYGSVLGSTGSNSIINSFNFEALDKMIDEKGGEEKEQLRKMIQEIRELFEDSEKVKRGSLAKFSELMEKHSWITATVAQLGFGFLTGQ